MSGFDQISEQLRTAKRLSFYYIYREREIVLRREYELTIKTIASSRSNWREEKL